MVLPLVAWSFGGIESTTIAAFESRSVKDISWAASSVHWITVFLYLAYTIAVMLAVPSAGSSSIFSRQIDSTGINVVEAVRQAGYSQFADFITACLLYSVLSCGNSSLYMASRTLYGLASNDRVARRHDLVSGVLQYLGMINPLTGVPLNAVIFSWLIFCWVPLIGFTENGKSLSLADVSDVYAVRDRLHANPAS